MFLIMPVQRVPRYSLLLRDLLRHTTEDHNDYNDLCTALEKTNSTNMFLNQKKSEAEHRQLLSELSNSLLIPPTPSIPLILPNRRYITDGDLFLYNQKGKKKRARIYLFNDGVLLVIRYSNLMSTFKWKLYGFWHFSVSKFVKLEDLKISITPDALVSFQSVSLRDQWFQNLSDQQKKAGYSI